MKISEDILYVKDERVITGFINSSRDLEHNIYKQVDGGCIDLEDKKLKEALDCYNKNLINK